MVNPPNIFIKTVYPYLVEGGPRKPPGAPRLASKTLLCREISLANSAPRVAEWTV